MRVRRVELGERPRLGRMIRDIVIYFGKTVICESRSLEMVDNS